MHYRKHDVLCPDTNNVDIFKTWSNNIEQTCIRVTPNEYYHNHLGTQATYGRLTNCPYIYGMELNNMTVGPKTPCFCLFFPDISRIPLLSDHQN